MPDTPEMVEKVALALHRNQAVGLWAECDGPACEYYYEQARAAIAAMREPSEAMLARICSPEYEYPPRLWSIARLEWQLQIDEALGAPQEQVSR